MERYRLPRGKRRPEPAGSERVSGDAARASRIDHGMIHQVMSLAAPHSAAVRDFSSWTTTSPSMRRGAAGGAEPGERGVVGAVAGGRAPSPAPVLGRAGETAPHPPPPARAP